jgi:hypothetical protein
VSSVYCILLRMDHVWDSSCWSWSLYMIGTYSGCYIKGACSHDGIVLTEPLFTQRERSDAGWQRFCRPRGRLARAQRDRPLQHMGSLSGFEPGAVPLSASARQARWVKANLFSIVLCARGNAFLK